MHRVALATRGRQRIAPLTPPRSLAALLAVVAIIGVGWALIVPPWQSPDTVAHFGYVESLAQDFRLPGDKHRLGVSSDQLTADGSVGASRGAFYPEASPPNWSRADYDAYLRAENGADPPSASNGGGPNPASTNPPLYYLWGAAGYLIDAGGTAFGRLYAIQLWGVLLLLGTTIAAWLLAGETFGRRRTPQLACAAVAGLLPMTTFISTSVNPDALVITTWTFALWLGARVINRGARAGDCIALCAVTAAAILTKATSYALVVPVALALALGWLSHARPERRHAARVIVLSGLALVLPVLGWLALAHALGRPAINQINSTSGSHPFNIGQFLSYVWQFYLPKLPFLTKFRTTPQLPVYDIWLRQGTGAFGWLSVALPHWVYRVAGVLLAALLIAAAVAVARRVRHRRQLALLGFYALTLIALLGLLHVTEYRSIIAGQGPILQGRYLLPAVGLLGLAAGAVVVWMPIRWRPSACGLALTGLLVLQTISLATIVQAFYL
jgi:4-amino-4-deoxy-L-arabinose transferase-like glycosyltransferase